MKRTPMKRGKANWKRTPLRHKSQNPHAVERRAKYAKARKEYVKQFRVKSGTKAGYLCEACQKVQWSHGVDLHHKAGRSGSNMYDPKTFMAVCRPCHMWIHEHPIEARERNWLV